MCAAAFIYLAAGMILRIHAGVTTWRNYFVLGICLGFGYLAKAAVLPVAVLFILAGFSPGHRVRKWLPQAGMTLAGLTLIAAPYVILLSQRLGHFTFGETPKLAFAYQPNNIPLMHWQGGPPGLGKPVHPTRKIFERPAAFEFATPIPGTYPPGYDPTYWNEGVTPRFDFQQEKARIITSVPRLLDMFLGRFVSGVPATATMPALSAGILLMYVLAPKWRVSLRNLAGQWFLLVPPLGAFLMYALVLVETRYVGAYYAVFCAGLLAGVALPDLPEAKKWATTLTVQVVSVTLLILVIVTGFDVLIGANVGPKQWQVAEYLHQAGVRRGEQVAQVCGNGNLGWARLARVRITAEVPPASMRDYIQADDTLRSQVVSALFATGVKAIVSGIQQKTGCPTEWREVADTGMYVCTAPGLSSDALQGSPSANPHSVNH